MTTARIPAALPELLCFDLYAASRAVTAAYRPLLAQLELTYPQYLVLVVLWRERTQTVKELGAALELDYGTLTPLLRRMENRGLLTRRRRADDERSVTVAPTAAGIALRARTEHIPAAIAAALGLDEEQARDLQATLRGIRSSATAASGS